MIQVRGISFSLKKGRPIFAGLNLEASPGEFLVLTGHSGSGKTTLLRLLQMEIFPEEGEVNVAGHSSKNINSKKLVSLRRSIGVIFQDFRLINSMTTSENVALTLKVTGVSQKWLAERVLRTMGEIGIANLAHFYPEELSGGEKQKVAIARAIIGKPLLLLADEPTGSLDPEASRGIIGLLRKINIGGTTVLLASHSVSLFEGDRYRILKINNGLLAAHRDNGG